MTFWIGLLLVCVLAVLVVLARRRRVAADDLGTVSAQWLIEHRGYDYYSER